MWRRTRVYHIIHVLCLRYISKGQDVLLFLRMAAAGRNMISQRVIISQLTQSCSICCARLVLHASNQCIRLTSLDGIMAHMQQNIDYCISIRGLTLLAIPIIKCVVIYFMYGCYYHYVSAGATFFKVIPSRKKILIWVNLINLNLVCYYKKHW